MHSLDVLGDPLWQASSTPAQLAQWLDLLRDELAAGALGIGVLMGYAPRTDPAEYLAVARLAAEAGVPTYTHIRELVEADPTTPVDGAEEVVRAAELTGAAMHHCHVNSTSRRHVDRVLETISRATAAGSRVTLEAYPYGAGSTADRGLLPRARAARCHGAHADIAGPAAQRRADRRRGPAAGGARADTRNGLHRGVPRRGRRRRTGSCCRRSMAYPDAIVASDAMPVLWEDGRTESRDWPLPPGGSTHPRTAGTFTRSLAHDGPRDRHLDLARGLPPLLLPAGAGARRRRSGRRGRRATLRRGPTPTSSCSTRTPVTDTATYLDPTGPAVGVRAPPGRRHPRHPRRTAAAGRVPRAAAARSAALSMTAARPDGPRAARCPAPAGDQCLRAARALPRPHRPVRRKLGAFVRVDRGPGPR